VRVTGSSEEVGRTESADNRVAAEADSAVPTDCKAATRGVFDVRLHVTANSEREAWEIARRFLDRSRLIAPDGAVPRYVQLRPPARSRTFIPTMRPRKTPA
jgi:hypothetical protein